MRIWQRHIVEKQFNGKWNVVLLFKVDCEMTWGASINDWCKRGRDWKSSRTSDLQRLIGSQDHFRLWRCDTRSSRCVETKSIVVIFSQKLPFVSWSSNFTADIDIFLRIIFLERQARNTKWNVFCFFCNFADDSRMGFAKCRNNMEMLLPQCEKIRRGIKI